MCWNQRISLNTFLFSFFAIHLAYFNNVINIYSYFKNLSFSSMQLLEYFAWGNLNNEKNNRVLSQIGLFIIFIQPFFYIGSSIKVRFTIRATLIVLYLLFSLFCWLSFPIDFSMEKANNGHLAWNWLNFPVVIIFTWVAFSFGTILYEKEYLKFSIYILIFLAIFYTYYKTNTWGSLFCWIANLIAVKLIFQSFFTLNTSNNLRIKKKH